MNKLINSLDATPLRAAFSFSTTFLMMATLLLLLATGCNSQKTAIESTEKSADQREARQDRRGGPPSIDEVFKMDTDGDGKLAKSEVTGRLAEQFTRIDANSDGFITREEFENAPRPQRPNGGGPRQ